MESKLFGTISQSPPSLAFVPFFVILGGDFGIDKLSTDRINQTVPYYVNRLMAKGGDDITILELLVAKEYFPS